MQKPAIFLTGGRSRWISLSRLIYSFPWHKKPRGERATVQQTHAHTQQTLKFFLLRTLEPQPRHTCQACDRPTPVPSGSLIILSVFPSRTEGRKGRSSLVRSSFFLSSGQRFLSSIFTRAREILRGTHRVCSLPSLPFAARTYTKIYRVRRNELVDRWGLLANMSRDMGDRHI